MTRIPARLAPTVAAATLCVAVLVAEQPARVQRAPRSPVATPGDESLPVRRDPFVPVGEGAAVPARAGDRARGLQGLRTSEVELVGIVWTTDTRLAVLEAPDGRTYLARVNDRLADGTVREVTRDAVVFAVPQGSDDGGEGGVEVRKVLGGRPGGA